ncbi:MAG: AEC family transporter [Eubacteriales bacterium]|nr:AEC family transporter [Eubacteriales bacterium]
MELAKIVLRQCLTMGLFMVAGFALFKSGKVNKEGSKAIAALLVWLIIPLVLVRSFCVAYSPEKLAELGVSFLLGALSLGLSIGLAWLLMRRNPIECFASAFSNAGFIGIPLATACLGESAAFYLSGMLILINLLQWTWGVSIIRRDGARFSLRSFVLENPYLVSTLIGVVLFVTGWGEGMPALLADAMDSLCALNAPLAMLMLGMYLAETRLLALFVTPRLYLTSAVRLLVIPAIILLAFKLLPVSDALRLPVLIASAAPCGANVAIYAQMFGADYPYACQNVVLSTMLSIFTLPLIIALAGVI